VKSYCIFREDIHSPIFESEYDLNTGLIDNIPDYKFKCKLSKYFINEFDVPEDYGSRFMKEYYIKAIQMCNGLIAFNFYDAGITVITKNSIFVYFIENGVIREYKEEFKNISPFNYNKNYIGTYKTEVIQFDIEHNFCLLCVDNEGVLLTENGEIRTDIVNFRGFSDILNISGSISIWRDGFDGLLYDNENNLLRYKLFKDNLLIEVIK
jgi:hypothetical protein